MPPCGQSLVRHAPSNWGVFDRPVFAPDRATILRCPWVLWGDERSSGKVGGHAPWISREQRPAGHGGVSADEEVGEDGLACPSGAAVFGVGVACEECGGGRDLLDGRHRWQSRAQLLYARESRRDLREDDGVEDQGASLSGLGELLLRPGEPACVFGE